MILYLLRHGIAEDQSSSGRDQDRTLTPEGIERLQRVLHVAAQAGAQPRIILSSTYRRAMQTAAQAKKILRVDEEIVTSTAFIPDASPRDAWQELRTWSDESEILLATHEPLVSSLLSHVLGIQETIHGFRKAGLAKVELTRLGPQPAGVLEWLLTPGLAKAVHKA